MKTIVIHFISLKAARMLSNKSPLTFWHLTNRVFKKISADNMKHIEFIFCLIFTALILGGCKQSSSKATSNGVIYNPVKVLEETVPDISNLKLSGVNETEAVISYDGDKPEFVPYIVYSESLPKEYCDSGTELLLTDTNKLEKSLKLSGLKSSTTYYFQICQRKISTGKVLFSKGISKSIRTLDLIPGEVSNLSVSQVSSGAGDVNLTWSVATRASEYIVSYILGSSSAPADCDNSNLKIKVLEPKILIKGLGLNQYMAFRVCAVNTNPLKSAGATGLVFLNTPVPSEVINLKVSLLKHNSAKLEWTSIGTNIGYKFRASISTSSNISCSQNNVTSSLNAEFQGLLPKTQYYVIVCSDNNDSIPIVSPGVKISFKTPDAPACGDIAHGEYEYGDTKYQTSSVPYGSVCVEQTASRQCQFGNFGEWSSVTFTKPTCIVAPAPANITSISCSGEHSTKGITTLTVTGPASSNYKFAWTEGTQPPSEPICATSATFTSSFSNGNGLVTYSMPVKARSSYVATTQPYFFKYKFCLDNGSESQVITHNVLTLYPDSRVYLKGTCSVNPSPAKVARPSISYPNLTAIVGKPIAIAPNQYSGVSVEFLPALPNGLTFDPITGSISGILNQPISLTKFKAVVRNAADEVTVIENAIYMEAFADNHVIDFMAGNFGYIMQKSDGKTSWFRSGYNSNMLETINSKFLSIGFQRIIGVYGGNIGKLNDGSWVGWNQTTIFENWFPSNIIEVNAQDKFYSYTFQMLKSDGSYSEGNPVYPNYSSQTPLFISAGVTKIFSSDIAGYLLLLSDGSLISSRKDQVLSAPSNVKDVTHNVDSFVILRLDGSVVNWPSTVNTTILSQLKSGITKVFASKKGYAFAALKENGSVVTWGKEESGGDSSIVAKKLSNNVVQIYPRPNSFAALKADGSVVSWGYLIPKQDQLDQDLSSGVVKIFGDMYDDYYAALKEDGSLVFWGPTSFPTAPPEELKSGVTKVLFKNNSFVALKNDGTVLAGSVGTSQIYLNEKVFKDIVQIEKDEDDFLVMNKDAVIEKVFGSPYTFVPEIFIPRTPAKLSYILNSKVTNIKYKLADLDLSVSTYAELPTSGPTLETVVEIGNNACQKEFGLEYAAIFDSSGVYSLQDKIFITPKNNYSIRITDPKANARFKTIASTDSAPPDWNVFWKQSGRSEASFVCVDKHEVKTLSE